MSTSTINPTNTKGSYSAMKATAQGYLEILEGLELGKSHEVELRELLSDGSYLKMETGINRVRSIIATRENAAAHREELARQHKKAEARRQEKVGLASHARNIGAELKYLAINSTLVAMMIAKIQAGSNIERELEICRQAASLLRELKHRSLMLADSRLAGLLGGNTIEKLEEGIGLADAVLARADEEAFIREDAAEALQVIKGLRFDFAIANVMIPLLKSDDVKEMKSGLQLFNAHRSAAKQTSDDVASRMGLSLVPPAESNKSKGKNRGRRNKAFTPAPSTKPQDKSDRQNRREARWR